MNIIRFTMFIATLLLTITLSQGKPVQPSSSSNIEDYTKYLLNLITTENEYARFLSYLKIFPPKDNDNMRALYDDLFSFNAYISDIAHMYEKYYTLDEILQLIEFYSSPLGKKTLEFNNDLNQQMEDIMLTKISDYIFTSAEHNIHIPLPEIH
ncbi:unnamed protein product [Adineta steineri]|uniref:DUF2059 domain-containing protein n=1 Tax=Adineta steineri TaxID=433720 RepID=A0A815TH30_9BILA|nr:unnamed protein product [Adineta steineri]CAF1120646.1 unnamed protein product [Adineta steineri]CAF1124873.1 unnamed protein product [Adineta steineri]CAF1199340.1 unnamed protein product [Adineta steineri]CAF1412187.1 unnamed protein product [Adineta steineri]